MILNNQQKAHLEKLAELICAEYDFEFVPIELNDYSQAQQCYANVAEKVGRDGGKTHYGWSVHFNGNIIEAERHAVWENANEDLICVTPHPSKYKQVLFFSYNIPVDPQEQIDNVRLNITDNKIVDDWIYVSNVIGEVYKSHSKRRNDHEVVVTNETGAVLEKLEERRGLIMGVIQTKRKNRSYCFCIKGYSEKRRYLDCHSKNLKAEIETILKQLSTGSV